MGDLEWVPVWCGTEAERRAMARRRGVNQGARRGITKPPIRKRKRRP